MALFIIGLIAGLIALIALATVFFSSDLKAPAGLTAAVAGVLSIGLIGFSAFYSNGVGEAKVEVNSVTKEVVATVQEPGSGFKAPWHSFVEFDLFSQELVYAGKGDASPSYAGGTVNGAEVTVSVGGQEGGSTQANVDIAVTYSLDPKKVEDIYREFRSQEIFTKQVIEKQVLSAIRAVPSQYTAVEFRGEARGEAADKILEKLNEKLQGYGVQVDLVTIQNISYPEAVEAALTQIEEANQAAQKAEAEQRTAEVNAETKRIEAEGVAQANKILAESLSPEVLQQQYIDALKASGQVFVVPEGSAPLVTLPEGK